MADAEEQATLDAIVPLEPGRSQRQVVAELASEGFANCKGILLISKQVQRIMERADRVSTDIMNRYRIV